MKNEQIVNLLAAHADALIDDQDATMCLLAEVDAGPERSDLEFLFRLARALQTVLRPLTAPAEVAMLMIDDAREEAGAVRWVEKVEKRHLFWALGGAASVIAGTAGVMFWLRNRSDGNVQTAV